MKSEDIYEMGYAFPGYDITHNVRHWRYRDETITLPANAVTMHDVPGLRFPVAKWDDVKKAASNG